GGGGGGGGARRVLPEDRALELLELGARLDPELVHERFARAPVDVERLRLTAGLVEREHQLAARPLAERVAVHELLELRDQTRVTAEGEVGVDAVLERGEMLLLQPPARLACERLRLELGEGRAAP